MLLASLFLRRTHALYTLTFDCSMLFYHTLISAPWFLFHKLFLMLLPSLFLCRTHSFYTLVFYCLPLKDLFSISVHNIQ
ncbi:hypothetical protein FB446DRAFT_350874 [Lentinula raphanica]|nr:hypothetical protein FB446DRAFT_350874 [Lentinula raphanica]